MGNVTVLVATAIVSLVDPKKSPRIHGNLIPPSYASISVDRVIKDYRELGLDILEVDGEKTLGKAEHSFILWRKRYIMVPRELPRVLSPLSSTTSS
jgi:hypothetical protein